MTNQEGDRSRMSFKCPNCGASLTVSAQKQETSATDIKGLFPQELETMLTFTEEGQYAIIKPRKFLGSEAFSKIASIVRGANGEYISAGKESHFRIPTKK